MSAPLAEFIGTFLLVLLGNGVVANVVLSRTKGNNSGWIVIAAGWGMAVFVGAFCADKFSGAHLNPAVTIAMVFAEKLSRNEALLYILAQMVGAVVGGAMVFLFYREHFAVTEDADAKLACFSTGPAIRNLRQAFLCEAVATFALVFPIFLMVTPGITGAAAAEAESMTLGLGSLGLLPVGILVFAIGVSLGGTTGYAINPARDLGPRLAHFLLPVPGKRDSDWGYAWVPVLGPITGGVAAAVLFRLIAAT